MSFSSSGTTRRWLEDQGAWLALETIFDGYLARAFWMSTPEHVHFDSINEGIDEDIIRVHLAEVEERARNMCRRLSREQAVQTA